jgi:hypothetical protein
MVEKIFRLMVNGASIILQFSTKQERNKSWNDIKTFLQDACLMPYEVKYELRPRKEIMGKK